MSSAALQAAPHQSSTVTALATNSPTAAPISSRQYTSQGQQSRDPYYSQQGPNASPTSTRRPSRRPSDNGAAAPNHQSQQYYASTSTASDSSPIATSSRTTNHTSSSAAAAAALDRGPPIAPPRTSSNQQRNSGTATAAASAASRPSSSRRAQNEHYGRASMDGPNRSDRELTNGGGGDRPKDDTMAAAAAAAASRSRQRPDQRQQEQLPYRPDSNRDNRNADASGGATRSRHAGSTAQSPTAPSREANEVLNRMVVSQPEVDLEREQERMAEAVPMSVAQVPETQEGNVRVQRSRQDHSSSKREKSMKFGEYFLGNTLGEGEFGKVKMGWKQAGGVQVAIKLIRRDSVGTNPTRLAKIYREIAILREISHPNIVRLHEMVETDRYIGIILEYASGGELFDYILNHRYLKDNAARRLFAQLVSGVGYLHKKGIVHRDLKLENLLLDRNRNIIITDFGFANTFDARDELGDEVEYNLSSREYVKRMELDKVLPNGHRRGDLMQTSCGSPCYAAPELVVSDSLYTGRKVDVWSCGVILYAMLAGYLPFDDDPANPEGDNINLLYKYIVSTPLTFPEYVTPHARDLLRRILVPDPRKRADLFEVARHSWLSEYAHVVGFITSSTTTTGDIANATVSTEEQTEAPGLVRSASVREPSKAQKSTPSAVGDLARKHGNVDQDAEDAPPPKTSRDNKRRTVQVEYVAPRSETQRGGSASTGTGSSPRTRVRTSDQGPVEVAPSSQSNRRPVSTAEKPLPQDPPNNASRHSGSHRQHQNMAPPQSRPARESSRSVSDTAFMQPLQSPTGRPATGGSMTSVASRTPSMGLPSRGSYGQPVAPNVTGTHARGQLAQPNMDRRGSRGYVQPMPQTEEEAQHQQSNAPGVPVKFAKVAGYSEGDQLTQPAQQQGDGKGHKRSNTVGGISEKIFGRSTSMFGGTRQDKNQEKPKKSYPPVSMTSPVGETPRQSGESRRPTSFGFSKKRSGSVSGSDTKSRRFSLLPTSFSLKAIGIGKDYGTAGAPPSTSSRPSSRGNNVEQQVDGSYESIDSPYQSDRRATSTASPPQPQYNRRASQLPEQRRTSTYAGSQAPQYQSDQATLPNESETSFDQQNQNRRTTGYPPGFNDYDKPATVQVPSGRGSRGVLQKNNRKFTDAYGDEEYNGHRVAGSSGAARKVMDFFRLRGRARNGDDR